jgi:hypothetical protein
MENGAFPRTAAADERWSRNVDVTHVGWSGDPALRPHRCRAWRLVVMFKRMLDHPRNPNDSKNSMSTTNIQNSIDVFSRHLICRIRSAAFAFYNR